jgi:uncharacterized protein (UPF0548 family)
MVSLRKPSTDALKRFLVAQRELPFTYEAVGATAGTPPAGYVVDRTRIRLGEGEAVFRSASAALRRWEQFRLGWVEAWPPDTPIQTGEVVAVMGRALGVWWLNACRVVYVVDEAGPVSRFGFAYGTLPGHVESGEERFLVEWDRNDDAVWYDILAFSRPHHVLTRLGYPVVRRLQKRFGRDSAAAMLRAVRPAIESGRRPPQPRRQQGRHRHDQQAETEETPRAGS